MRAMFPDASFASRFEDWACQFGLLAATVFGHWGVRSTSDIGDIVYHLIEAGDLEKTPSDSRSDFDNVYDFETALRPKSLLANDDTV